jgi:hypothetical protein
MAKKVIYGGNMLGVSEAANFLVTRRFVGKIPSKLFSGRTFTNKFHFFSRAKHDDIKIQIQKISELHWELNDEPTLPVSTHTTPDVSSYNRRGKYLTAACAILASVLFS